MSLDNISPLTDALVGRVATPPRARGAVTLGVQARAGKTHIAQLRQAGCLKCILPTVFRDDAEAVLVNTAGGVTGGDVIEVDAMLGHDTHLSISTQAAERIYRTSDGTTGNVRNRITVGEGARLSWLPQETILFDRARLSRDLQIDLAPAAQLLLCETLVFGRAAMGEQVHDLHLEDRICVTRDGAPLYRDGIRLHGDAHAQLARPALGAGAGAVATVVCVTPQAEALLTPLRALLPETAGASLLRADLLVLRALAVDSLALRRFMIPVLELLSGQSLPGVWRL
ncbi:MAG: urease accessory protein UreD [Sulfitobacter sp.]